jgi:hypothetical protein
MINEAPAKLNKLHNNIINALSSTVTNAIEAGDILNTVKNEMDHGKFLIWIKDNCDFSERAARNYMKVSSYKLQLQNGTACADLQEAYKQIESIEAVEKRKEDERKQNLIRERIRTGQKPEGWDRSLDYEYEKRMKQGGYAKIKDNFEMPKSEPESTSNISDNHLKEMTDLFLEHHKKRTDFKDKIRLSADGKDDAFMDAIMDYLSELPDDNRRIEACNNIIKICRNISVELQAKKEN